MHVKCTQCEKWREDYIELEQACSAAEAKAQTMAEEVHISNTLHKVAVVEREEMAAELLRLKIKMKESAGTEAG